MTATFGQGADAAGGSATGIGAVPARRATACPPVGGGDGGGFGVALRRAVPGAGRAQ